MCWRYDPTRSEEFLRELRGLRLNLEEQARLAHAEAEGWGRLVEVIGG